MSSIRNKDLRSDAFPRGTTVTLVGGGNSTHCLAPLLASVGFPVNILTRNPASWQREIEVVNEDLRWLRFTKICARPNVITSNPAECIPQSDIVWFAGVPVHHNPALCRWIMPHLNPDRHVFIGSICVYGGFDWIVKKELKEYNGSYSCFGSQLIPWCCGTRTYGRTGVIFGAKRILRIATEGGVDKLHLKETLAPFLRQKLEDTTFLACSLFPNNSSLHPPILYGLFKDWDGKSFFDAGSLPVFIYKDMCQASGEAVVALDFELQSIVAALRKIYIDCPHLAKSFAFRDCVMKNYEDQIVDTTDVISCIRTNRAFAKHKIPYSVFQDGKVAPTIHHKFFETDLPYGLCLFKDIAIMCAVQTKCLDAIIIWNQKLLGMEYLAHDGENILLDSDTNIPYGERIHEAIVPSRMGFNLHSLQPTVTL